MKYSVAALVFAAGALADSYYGHGNGTAYTTITTTAITTYCPAATEVVHGGKTYTATEVTTLTITDCPCTVTKPIEPTHTPSTVLCTSCLESASSALASMKSIPAPPPNTYTNTLTVIYSNPAATKTNSGVAQGTGVAPTKPATFTGAASVNRVGGMIVGAVAGVVALAL